MCKKVIAFDSDGTLMDTMTIKHERSFAPEMLKVFEIKEGKEDIYNHWLDVNLYKKTRGINRFEGLAEILAYAHEKYGYQFEGYESFAGWVKTTPAYSEALLREHLAKEEHNPTIEKALEWSKRVNISISMLPPAKPFREVNKVVTTLFNDFPLYGVSSANRAAVNEEWERNGLSPYFRGIYCQDEGSKSAILKKIKGSYPDREVLMVGDAPKDLDEARKAGCLYFPITPKKENESFKKLLEAASRFKEGTYKGEYEDSLIEEFLTSLA